MEIIGDNSVITSVAPKGKVVYCRGETPRFWLELQFVDENNLPVTGLKVTLEYHPLASAQDVAMWKKYSNHHYDPTPPPNPPAGVTDSQGLVRFDDLSWITVDVKADAQQLADEMEQRPLGLRRNPNSQPVSKNVFRRETRDKSWRSDVQEKAEAAGHIHHYVTIGELCDQLPHIEGWEEKEPPEFHFQQGRSLKGTEIACQALKQRHVIEICPFRAWVLALHDTTAFDLANSLNLGIMADLAYSAEAKNNTIDYFFRNKCQDLSAIPQFAEFPSYYHTLAVDVPFRERYLAPVYLNTGEGLNPEGDTRLFTVECDTHIIVAWCGTDSLLNALTDISFAPKKCQPELGGVGHIHGGFLKAYQLAKQRFELRFQNVITSLNEGRGTKKLFICGHSLGGALALTYAAEMKNSRPILYTFGMPRTFTRAAVLGLDAVTHYRHVNDNDSVTQIPPDADVDNIFYEKWGPLGDKLGFDWSVTTLTGLGVAVRDLAFQSTGISDKKDPYWHHGNTVIFFQAQQCVMQSRHQNVPWIGGGGSDNPAPGVVSTCHKQSVKLFLVPSLNEECLNATGEHQAKFIGCLDTVNLRKTFPRNTNPELDGLLSNPSSHSMAHRYLPYIHNQVLELANPDLEMDRKEKRAEFRQEIEATAKGSANQDEVQRNQEFIALQDMLPVALTRTRSEDVGKNALLRFAAVTEEEVEFSK
ncbi:MULTISPECIES: lipase family protein [Rahnella]|jgi:type VI secretion system protein VasL|uniref:Lipase family protein n=1 Tax=Rahnella sp. (strain Y9602) TaxID=2703885 RepID=A0ABW6CDW1_RAHSY|nr:lipase family protein [Rahnella aceris]AYA09776.1 lipase family protein [Rahnella aquatilis]MBU9864005.1 lipase family protein [Rahnella aceris]MDP9705340.1 type VI secretion system protein VasL [Rahnella aquatilis]NIA90144.1 lipase family protein [Rahnella aceris]QEU49661.1 lipase family protein [Rahnella aquatilis]